MKAKTIFDAVSAMEAVIDTPIGHALPVIVWHRLLDAMVDLRYELGEVLPRELDLEEAA